MVFSRPKIRIKQNDIVVCTRKYYDEYTPLWMLAQSLWQMKAKGSALAFVLEVPALS